MTRAEILQTAEKMVCGQREQDYGTPEDNFAVIAKLWEDYIAHKCVGICCDVCVLPEDVALMMCLFKIARIMTGTATADSFIDLAWYAACGGEIATGEEEAPDNA